MCGTNLSSRCGMILMAGAVLVGCALFLAPIGSSPAEEAKKPITVADVNAAQQAWCDGLVKIGKVYAEEGDYKAAAKKVIDDLYDFEDGKVFFKPTLAFGKNTFRKTKQGALAYFVGGDADFPEDKGFALKPWVKVRYDNFPTDVEGVQIHGDIALTMGNVYLTDKSGKEIMVDKTFAFRRCKDGKLRLIIHKSALPFTPEK
ncbi:MAG: hypothetical protein U0840_21135 [Gemmataceae bacterium]